jgi:hypothetical protein
MYRAGVLTLLTIVVTGCSTTIKELREHPVRMTYVSERSAPALEQCLAGNLSWIASPSVVRGETSSEVALGNALLVTLSPMLEGTQVQVRELLTYGKRVRNNVEACVTGRDK